MGLFDKLGQKIKETSDKVKSEGKVAKEKTSEKVKDTTEKTKQKI